MSITKVEIYTLSHPISNEIRYVGKANNSEKRLKQHIRECKRRNTPVYDWIRSLAKEGLTPVVNVILETDSENWKEAEIKTIAHLRSSGERLLNVALGGDEPFCSKDQRAINGRNNANKIHSDPKAKRLWQLKQAIGCSIRFFEKRGMHEQAAQTRAKLAQIGIYV